MLVPKPKSNAFLVLDLNVELFYYFAGFLRFKPDGSSKVSLVLSHNFGLATIEEGYLENECLKLKSTSISRIDFSKEPGVTELQRTFKVVDDSTLWQTVLMATTKTALTKHLEAKYVKIV